MELYEQQLNAFNLVTKKKKNVFITGLAGVGKSALIHHIHGDLILQGYETICVAPTGKAALNMPGQGTTISRNVGMKRGKDDYLPSGCFDRSAFNGIIRPSITTIYKNVDNKWQAPKLAVFIDEAGQLSSENARLFFDLGMLKRRDKGDLDPPLFIFTADFGQLAPIKGACVLEEAVYEYNKEPNLKETIVLPSIIEEIKPEFIELTEIVRQSDPVYLRALRWVYYGIALHPAIKKRFYEKAPPGVKRVMFNNDEVVAENKRYVENYLKENPNKKALRYKAIYDPRTVSQTYLKDLIPVLPEMTIAEGMTFNVTENVPTIEDRRKLLVANGEAVIVTKVTSSRGIRVLKSNGEEVDLNYVQHSLPVNSKKSKPTFMQLPGYVGPSLTLYRVQGQTYREPIEFGAWQWIKEKRKSLKNHQGSLYVMLSRNTSLDDLYFDTSFGIDEAISLLKSAISLNKNVEKYVRAKKPLYVTDPLAETIVIELEDVMVEDIPDFKSVAFLFRSTRLDIEEEKVYMARYVLKNEVVIPLFYWLVDEINQTQTLIENPELMDVFESIDNLSRIWITERYTTYVKSK